MSNALKNALLQDIQQSLFKALDETREIVTTHLQDEGDTCSDCQRVCFLNTLHSLETLITGISVDDLK